MVGMAVMVKERETNRLQSEFKGDFENKEMVHVSCGTFPYQDQKDRNNLFCTKKKYQLLFHNSKVVSHSQNNSR